MNRYALITGATSGIGLELARRFALDHHNLILVARDAQMLDKVARELHEEGSPHVVTIPADLATKEGPAHVFNTTEQMGLQVEILVNDAGVGVHGAFLQTDLAEELRIIQLNIASLVFLTKVYARQMARRHRGKIMQVASIASYQPTPLLAVYAATKSFVLSFTDALINEFADSGITMTALIPGPTDTDFFRKAHMENTRAAQEDPEQPDVVAQIGYDALMKGQHHAVAPGMKKEIAMSSILPNERVAAKARKSMEEVDSRD
jgi:uncharacterized protein